MADIDAKALRRGFNRWFLRYADPDHKFTHIPRWLKSDLWDAYQAGHAALILSQAETIAELKAEIERLTPLAAAYDYLEAPSTGAGKEP